MDDPIPAALSRGRHHRHHHDRPPHRRSRAGSRSSSTGSTAGSGSPGIPSPRRRGWIANLADDPQLTVHLKGPIAVADLPATARIVDDPTERRAMLERVARAWRRTDLERMVASQPADRGHARRGGPPRRERRGAIRRVDRRRIRLRLAPPATDVHGGHRRPAGAGAPSPSHDRPDRFTTGPRHPTVARRRPDAHPSRHDRHRCRRDRPRPTTIRRDPEPRGLGDQPEPDDRRARVADHRQLTHDRVLPDANGRARHRASSSMPRLTAANRRSNAANRLARSSPTTSP